VIERTTESDEIGKRRPESDDATTEKGRRKATIGATTGAMIVDDHDDWKVDDWKADDRGLKARLKATTGKRTTESDDRKGRLKGRIES
jgi:hypothetical protein